MEIISCLEAKDKNDPFVIAQRNEIEFTLRYERENGVRWRDLIKSKQHDTKTLRRLLLGAGSQFMQQFGGINIMSYYLPTIMEKAVKLEKSTARLLTACNAISYMVFAGLAVLLVERMGRRGLMMLSTFGQFVCFLVITILLRFSETSSNSQAFGSAAVAFIFLVCCMPPRCHFISWFPDFGSSSITRASVSVCFLFRGCTPQRSTLYR